MASAGSASTTSTGTSCSASASAVSSPTGPAPATITCGFFCMDPIMPDEIPGEGSSRHRALGSRADKPGHEDRPGTQSSESEPPGGGARFAAGEIEHHAEYEIGRASC